MAADSAVRSVHNTAGAASEDVITLTGAWREILVTNRGTTNPLYFRTDGTAAVAEANETIFLAPGSAKKVRFANGPVSGRTIRLISTSGTTYSVEGF